MSFDPRERVLTDFSRLVRTRTDPQGRSGLGRPQAGAEAPRRPTPPADAPDRCPDAAPPGDPWGEARGTAQLCLETSSAAEEPRGPASARFSCPVTSNRCGSSAAAIDSEKA